MADVIFIAILVAFFALATLFVQACDHIIGSEDVSATEEAGGALEERAA